MIKHIEIDGVGHPIIFNLWAMTRIEEELEINFSDTTAAIGGNASLKTKLEIANIGFAAGYRAEGKTWENKDWEAMSEFLQDDGDILEILESVYLYQVFGKKLEDIVTKTDKVVEELAKAIKKEKDEVVKKGLEDTMDKMKTSAAMSKNVLARIKETSSRLPSPGSSR